MNADSPDNALILTQCFPPQIGGIETLMAGLARALCDSGATVAVFADDGADARRYDSDSAAPFAVRRFGGWKILRRRRKARAAHQFVLQTRAAAFCDSWKSAELLPFAGAAVFAHGTEYPRTPSPRKRRRIAAAISRTKTIFAVSSAAKERAINCGADAAKIKITPPPLTPPPPPSDSDRERAEELWNGASPRILTVARLAPRKGIDRTLAAATRLVPQYPNLKYIVCGGGAQEKELRALAANAGMQSRAHFAGPTTDGLKSALLESADIFALPARAEKDDMEGFGIVYLEAAWFGLPCIGGDSGGAKEAVLHDNTGLLCDGANPESVRAALAAVLGDAERRARFSANARARARAHLWQNRLGDFW